MMMRVVPSDSPVRLCIAHVNIAALVRAFGSPWQRQPWGCKPVTRRMVDAALRRPHPVGKEVYSSERRKIGDQWTDAFGLPTHRYHAQRVAWLLTHGWTEPIKLDVGEPDLGIVRYWPPGLAQEAHEGLQHVRAPAGDRTPLTQLTERAISLTQLTRISS